MATGGNKVYRDPIKYELGKDLTSEKYHEILAALTGFFATSRKTKEPAILAKQEIELCLQGVKKDGTPWFGAATSTLASRIKIMCRFDIETMKSLESASDKQKAKKDKEKKRLAAKRARALHDDNIPDEIRSEIEKNNDMLRKEAKYGDDPMLFLSSRELDTWNRIKEGYLKQYPAELGSIAAQAELDTLCDLHILNERHRFKLLKGQAVDPGERKSVVEQLDKLKSSIGIHPTQLARRVKAKGDTTIAAAAQQITKLDDWMKLRLRFFAEEMMQLWQMYQHLSADGTTYQLDEVAFYSATRCRTCVCSGCGQRNAVGFSIDEIEKWLADRGVIREVEDAGVS